MDKEGIFLSKQFFDVMKVSLLFSVDCHFLLRSIPRRARQLGGCRLVWQFHSSYSMYNVILDIFQMIFRFLLHDIPKKSKAVGLVSGYVLKRDVVCLITFCSHVL